MHEYQVMYWRDIPAQVRVFDGRKPVSRTTPERFQEEIREAFNEDTEAHGHDSPEAFVATFRRSDMLWSEDGRKSLLAWFMAERTAWQIVEEVAR